MPKSSKKEGGKNKRSSYFAAQTTYLQHDPRRATLCHTASPHVASIVLHGSKSNKLTIGRGHKSQVQVGRRNPKMSRQHFVIEHKPHSGYTLTVQSPNGVLVDRIMFMAGEHIPLVNGSMIEVLGNKLVFAGETQQQEQHERQEQQGQQQGQQQQQEEQRQNLMVTNHKRAEEKHTRRKMDEIRSLSPSAMKNASKITTVDRKNDASSHTDTPKIQRTTTHRSVNEHITESHLSPRSRPLDFLDKLIRILANSRKTTMTIPEIRRQLNQERETLMGLIQTTACIGCIERTGSTADGSPKEHLYYYKPELDSNDERRLSLSQSRRGARKCALKDTQYYFRIPPKLPNHRTKTTPETKRRSNGQLQHDQGSLKKKLKVSSTLPLAARSRNEKTSPKRNNITKRPMSANRKGATTTTPATMPTASSSSLSLSSDDLLSDGFLSSDDECSDKEMTALFQDV